MLPLLSKTQRCFQDAEVVRLRGSTAWAGCGPSPPVSQTTEGKHRLSRRSQVSMLLRAPLLLLVGTPSSREPSFSRHCEVGQQFHVHLPGSWHELTNMAVRQSPPSASRNSRIQLNRGCTKLLGFITSSPEVRKELVKSEKLSLYSKRRVCRASKINTYNEWVGVGQGG